MIGALWARGIDTEGCCQEYRPGTVWIAFASADDALAFCRAVRLDDDPERADDLSVRALQPDVAASDASPPLVWDWDWSAKPYPTVNVVSIAVEFPRSDLPVVRERLGVSSDD